MKNEHVDTLENSKFTIDWEDALEEEEVPELEIVGSDEARPRESNFSGEESVVCVKSLRDNEIDDDLRRHRSLLSKYGEKLSDNGNKIRRRIGELEHEKQRRLFLPRKKMQDANKGCLIIEKPKSSGVVRQTNTASNDSSRQGNTGSKDVSRSTFAAHFSDKPKVDSAPVKLSNDKLQNVGSGSWKSKANRDSVTEKSTGWRSLPRLNKSKISEKNFYSEFKDPKGNQKASEASGNRKRKEHSPSPYFLVDDDDDEEDVIGYKTPREWSLKASPSESSSCRKKSDAKVIDLDEDESQSPVLVEQTCELPEGLPEAIYYPSRDVQDLLQVSLKDLKCLSPGQYLTSEVINFYIRFLQHDVFSSYETAGNCHFFSTFFYPKLIEAVSYKGNDRDAFFVKFRRWWKGLDLFRKSYIFIPIHKDHHWSLVIICIPEKEDESGLTVLHLDSLGMHPRSLILNHVKRFLIEEWNYLNQDDLSLDLPISEKVWSDLPNRINKAQVQVPQQKNDFDCGLFVLFFIKRFIEEAPLRLGLQDLGMIHKNWFNPDEASALRNKIWNVLVDLFRKE